ncbi:MULTISPECIES: phosphoribosylanthranilate isomerase [Nitrosomonas]|uniref:N-(5'-phosphoribosyl)anthranilate isomerase n=1 Tax=Nitrosomonas communis TaxID=44574 RepID=A0A0F7KEN5_9PROT|nr:MULTISPECIES: phosphoribosylanthranilate isomerase [Nitrosomonas]AKH38920.1 N-(5'-phosphoribosyl)anthranilate isomerase [Nitrosomonas communis]TYP91855.1 phosphoribosylanthranilate isomerase [Nitrosomonas communis]UVS61059.1 phosphoribosylanthranilate isomerase [Nitrosomonas sp. PLL12]
MSVRVKICGITRVEDALVAVQHGADAIGFVFWRQSTRFISPAQAREIVVRLPPFVNVVGVYVDPSPEWVEETSITAGLSLLQFHGEETPEFCNQFKLPYIKALRVRREMNLLQYAELYQNAKGLLLDAYTAGMPGGTGQVFDWSLIPTDFPLPLVLSGGLNSDNVVNAIRQVRPWAVDVSSGVEARKGIKDVNKISAFMQGVKNCEDL